MTNILTTPTGPHAHGRSPVARGLMSTPSSSTTEGRFGRMFRRLPVYEQRPESLVALGQAMIQGLEDGRLDKPLGEDDDDENRSEWNGELRLPAGYTYFGQFVDHDITFDPASSLTRQNDPDALHDFRTPRFDLDSLYGRGPSDQPYLYDEEGLHLRLGATLEAGGRDLPRVETGRAVIGDPRNDENVIVSQLHVAFIRFHNAVVDHEAQDGHASKADRFKHAQQTVRWHYQWIVVHDYLPRLVGDAVVADILVNESYAVPGANDRVEVPTPRLRFYRWRERPFMPVEFSAAAYRFGHSIVRPSYLINHEAEAEPPAEGVSRIPLFSELSGPRESLRGFRPVPEPWGVEWEFLLPRIDGARGEPHLPQPSYKLDTQLSNPLGILDKVVADPEASGLSESQARNLAVRNLLRGRALGLPSGQDVARAMGIEPLGEDRLYPCLENDPPQDLRGAAPLWYYVLREAESRAGSEHLGPVGGRIVAEVLIGLLVGDPFSYLSVQPNWQPTLPHARDDYTLSDLINFATRQE